MQNAEKTIWINGKNRTTITPPFPIPLLHHSIYGLYHYPMAAKMPGKTIIIVLISTGYLKAASPIKKKKIFCQVQLIFGKKKI